MCAVDEMIYLSLYRFKKALSILCTGPGKLDLCICTLKTCTKKLYLYEVLKKALSTLVQIPAIFIDLFV